MRMVLDPRVNQLLQMVNQLADAAVVLPRWPKRRIDGPSSGGADSAVLVNVDGLDLAREIHAVLVPWCDLVAEQRGVEPLDPAWSSWVVTPSGSWVATSGNTREAVAWLRPHASWVVYQPWYIDEMWPELLELRRKVRSLMGLAQPPRRLVEMAVELATSGRSMVEVREVARARRADA